MSPPLPPPHREVVVLVPLEVALPHLVEVPVVHPVVVPLLAHLEALRLLVVAPPLAHPPPAGAPLHHLVAVLVVHLVEVPAVPPVLVIPAHPLPVVLDLPQVPVAGARPPLAVDLHRVPPAEVAPVPLAGAVQVHHH